MINKLDFSTKNNQVFAPFNNNDAKFYVTKPITQEQKEELKQDEEKKGNRLGYSIAISAIGVGLLSVFLMKGLPKSFRQKLSDYVAKISRKKSLTGTKTETRREKFVKTLNQYVHGFYNTGPLKDVLIMKFSKKIPILETAAEKITKLFERISIRTSRRSYNSTLGTLSDIPAKLDDFTARLSDKDRALVAEKISSMCSTFDKGFGSVARKNRIKTIHSELNGIDEQVWEKTYKKLWSFLKDKDLYHTYISDTLAAPTKKMINSEITSYQTLIKENIKDIQDIYAKSGELSADELKHIDKTFKKFENKLDKSVDIEGDKLFDKIRDLKIGAAPTDVFGVLTSLAVIGWGLTKADNKDERVSVLIKYGIPTIGAMLISLYCTVGLFAGGTALLIGMLSGFGLNLVGAAVDKARLKYKEKPLTLDDIKIPSPIIPGTHAYEKAEAKFK